MKSQPYLWKRSTNGVYYVVFWDGPLAQKRRMESLKTRDRRTADDRFFLWKQQRAQEEILGIRHVGVPLQDAVGEYLKHFEKRNKAISVTRYRNALGNVLAFVGEDLPLGSLSVKELQDYQLHRVVKANKRTVDYEVDVMRAFLNWCRKRSWVRENVADNDHVERLIKANHPDQEKRIFTDEELKVLLSPQDGPWRRFYFIFNALSFTGVRIGELGFLTTKDVDLKRQEIHIRNKTLNIPVWSQAKKKNVVRKVSWTPKWYEERVVPIDARLEPVLREFHERRTDNIYGLYFLSERGCQITDHISRPIKGLTNKGDVSAHTFRHTHISHALNRWGRYPSVVQKWVGHKKLETTQQYIHVSAEDLHREAKKTGI